MLLITQGLQYQYNSQTNLIFPNLSLGYGQSLLLTGNSGAGKTTLLHLITGLLPLQKGSIELDGKSYQTMTSTQMDRFRGRQIGIVFQQNHFIKSMTVQQNLFLNCYLNGIKQEQDLVDHHLQALGLAHKANHKIETMSQGEKQRLALARAAITQPKLLIADEPTANLDDRNCFRTIELFVEHANHHNTGLLIATHDNRLKQYFKNQSELLPHGEFIKN